MKVTVTVETVASGAQLLRQTIVIDRTSESELRYCDEACAKEKHARQNSAVRAKGVRQRLSSFVIWVGGMATVVLVATLILSTWGIPFYAIASGLAALILQSTVRAAGQIAGHPGKKGGK